MFLLLRSHRVEMTGVISVSFQPLSPKRPFLSPDGSSEQLLSRHFWSTVLPSLIIHFPSFYIIFTVFSPLLFILGTLSHLHPPRPPRPPQSPQLSLCPKFFFSFFLDPSTAPKAPDPSPARLSVCYFSLFCVLFCFQRCPSPSSLHPLSQS